MIRILFIDEPLNPPGGGQISLLTFLRSIDKTNYNVKVFIKSGGVFEDMLKKTGIDVEVVPLLRLGFKIFEYSPHIVHINSATTKYSFFSALFSKCFGSRVVWHNRVLDSSPWRERILSSLVDRIIVVSDEVAKKFNYVKEKVIKIYNPIDFENIRISVDKDELKKHLRISKDSKIIGIFSRLEKWKGHELLIKVFSKLICSYNNLILIVCGEGSEFDSLKKLSYKLNISDKIIFRGFVENVYDYMNMCDIIVNPSIKPEPFGRVIVEAMALGKIVVSTNFGGPKEVVEDGKNGFLVEPSLESLLNTISKILEGNFNEQEIKINAKNKALEYDVKRYLEKIYKIYNEL